MNRSIRESAAKTINKHSYAESKEQQMGGYYVNRSNRCTYYHHDYSYNYSQF